MASRAARALSRRGMVFWHQQSHSTLPNIHNKHPHPHTTHIDNTERLPLNPKYFGKKLESETLFTALAENIQIPAQYRIKTHCCGKPLQSRDKCVSDCHKREKNCLESMVFGARHPYLANLHLMFRSSASDIRTTGFRRFSQMFDAFI